MRKPSFSLPCYGERGLSFPGGEGRRLNLDVVDESKSHVASESETRESHFFILKANSCSETSRLNHFLHAQKFSECAHTHTFIYIYGEKDKEKEHKEK